MPNDAGDGHLGRDVNREIGRVLPNQPAHADILHNHGTTPAAIIARTYCSASAISFSKTRMLNVT